MTSETSRRQFVLESACAWTSLLCSGAVVAQSNAPNIDDWMQQWMRDARAPEGTLHLSRFADRMYFLTRPIAWRPEPSYDPKLAAVEVPVGFVTDFASVPRTFWSLLPPDGAYTYPAIVHDYLYWTRQQSRAAADEILYLGMKEFKVPEATAMTIYSAVRGGGGLAWASNGKLKSRGESRILKAFPDDPRVSWKEWKKDATHFVR